MSLTTDHRSFTAGASYDAEVLQQISQRVLWLASAMVDAANAGRPNDTGVKVGGHQASSASMVDIMVALWFAELTSLDRVSVKPHASPVLHAINYLLGDLDESYLPSLRAMGGLQSYPSRLKDPDTVDFSTGSVGIGATAALWSAMSHRYVASRFTTTPPCNLWWGFASRSGSYGEWARASSRSAVRHARCRGRRRGVGRRSERACLALRPGRQPSGHNCVICVHSRRVRKALLR